MSRHQAETWHNEWIYPYIWHILAVLHSCVFYNVMSTLTIYSICACLNVYITNIIIIFHAIGALMHHKGEGDGSYKLSS